MCPLVRRAHHGGNRSQAPGWISRVGIVRARWAFQHCGHVLEQLDATIEGTAVDHVECNIGVAGVDPPLTGVSCDDWKHDDAEAVHEAGFEQTSTTSSPTSPGPAHRARRHLHDNAGSGAGLLGDVSSTAPHMQGNLWG